MNRSIAAVILATVLTACGGGGGGGGGASNNPLPSGGSKSVAYTVGVNGQFNEIDLDRQETRLIASAFSTPIGVAVTEDASLAYILDGDVFEDSRISEVDLGDSSIRRLGRLADVSGIAVGASGTVYLAVAAFNGASGGRLRRLDPTTNVTSSITSALNSTRNVVVDAAETTAYVLNTSNAGDQLMRVDLATGATEVVAQIPLLAEFSPNGLALSPDETFAVTHGFSDPDIHVVDLATGHVTSVPVNHTCSANALNGPIAFDSDSSVIVTDSVDCLTRVNLDDNTSETLGDGSGYGSPGVFVALFAIVTQ